MSFLVSLLLPFVVSLLLTLGASFAWWQTLRAPWLFVTVGFLSLLGLHRAVQAAFELCRLFFGKAYFLEARGVTPSTVELVQESLTREAVTVAIVTAAVGIPLMFWLRRALQSA